MSIKNKTIKLIITIMALLSTMLIFSCTNSIIVIEKDNDFIEFVKGKNESIDKISDIYDDVAYVKYVDLDKYYSYSKIKNSDKVIYYEGDIEYYDKNDTLIKKDEKVTKLISTSNGEIESEGINNYGYLINSFGMLELEPGFHRYGDNYYYVSDETHKVSKCSNATMSNAIRKHNRKIIVKDDGEYIVYTDSEHENELVKNQISNIDGEVFLTDINGKIVTEEGIHHVSNIYDDTFHLVYEGLDGRFRKSNDRYFDCYVNKDGKVVVADKILIDGKTYLSDFDGFLVRDAYLLKGVGCDENMIYTGDDNLENLELKMIYNLINKRIIDRNSSKDYALYNENKAEEGKELKYFIGLKDEEKDVYAFKNGKLILNDIAIYDGLKYYAGNDGKLLKSIVVSDYKYKLLVADDGRVVNDIWIFDKQYYDDVKLNSKKAPYMRPYEIDRESIKPYLGRYVLPSGEIMMEDIYIESAILDNNKNVVVKYKIKNGEYDGKYDEHLYYLNTYQDDFPEYNYEEVDEGYYAFVHRYTDKTRNVKIEPYDVDRQLKYYKLRFDYQRKLNFDFEKRFANTEHKDTVLFGKYYNHDESGEILEPIEWDIYEKKNGMALLISNKIIDNLEFDINGNNKWEESGIRKWLNEDFLNLAFTKEEQERILANSQNEGRSGTNDKVFFLSMDEFEKYDEKNNDDSLYKYFCSTTPYACRGLDNLEKHSLSLSFWHRSIIPNAKDEIKDDYNDMWYGGSKYLRKTTKKNGIRPSIWVKYNDD